MTILLLLAALYQSPRHLADPFATGWMLVDTNADGIADSIAGKIVVPALPSAAECAAAANIAARLGYGTSGLTPPVVIMASEDRKDGPRIYINQNDAMRARLLADEGGVFEADGNLYVVGNNDAGLLAASEAYASRAPYAWKVPGDRLPASALGVTYVKGKTGVNRVFDGSAFTESAAVVVAAPATPASAPPAADDAGPQRLDIATLYTMRGLFRGTARMPIPSNSDAQLYVPGGAAGVALANLAARMGLETTGITLPLAVPAAGVAVRDVRTKSVVAGDNDIAREAEKNLRTEDQVASLGAGVGEMRIVDKAFARQSGVLVRGDDAGATAALGWLADRAPNVWESGKQHLSLEEIRYDLHRFLSLRSAPGQAAVALYWLAKWKTELRGASNVQAAIYTDVADAKLAAFATKQLGMPVTAASLHAGTQCCDKLPALHYEAPGYAFHQAKPTFEENIDIPWEGTRLLDAVKKALPKISAPVKVVARVSESPEVRRKLRDQLISMLPAKSDVTILCAFKQGYSWLVDEIAPQLAGKGSVAMTIEFRKNADLGGERVMYTPARWVQELYPVDEVLAKQLSIPLKSIELSEFEGPAKGPTYRVHAFDAAHHEILSRAFTVTTVEQPYNGAIPRYEQVQVSTGWLHIESAGKTIVDQRIKTDIEEFWDHYQNQTLPRIFKFIMAQSHGELKPEFAPPFDTLKIDFHLSEPDYDLGIDKERISTLEALQEDTFYTTENFVNTIGNLEAGRAVNYAGRIIPIVHKSDEGLDGRVHIEFYGKPAANPMATLTWTDAAGKRHERHRDMTVLSDPLQPRLIAARVHAGGTGVESLTWLASADYKEDAHDAWIAEEGADQVERSIVSVEQAAGQVHWLAEMQAAGLYRDELAYPHLKQMGIEFELPVPRTEKIDAPSPRAVVEWPIHGPAHARPMITDVAASTKPVQWDEPISPAESAAQLARLAKHPGVNVYWMGRSFLGENVWAADFTLPSPSLLRSPAKETTLKASIFYSGRQHANEVSSTSHLLKLGEELVADPSPLKQVNVILHPITNPDGAQLSVELAGITPDNMLHPGYHGALAADVTLGQPDIDPVYPESRTRRQLLESWLPDAFLNPHGYPSHEWVQPFSEYSGWVTSRQSANSGRTWWIPRGWFTSLTYLRDAQHPYSEKVAYELRDRIVAAERAVPGLLPLEDRMNARYERFGQRWQPRNMQQPIVNGIRIYMALKGAPARGGGAAGAPIGATGGVSPDVTWDSGYTEAPDETAHGDYMKLMAAAGLAFDRVHLDYMAGGKLRITRTEREAAGKVTWRVERLRPNLPAGETESPRAAQP